MHGFFPHQWKVHLTNWGCDKMVAISETTLANLVSWINKANLRDLIVATGLVILLKLDSNRWFFNLYDLEIWWMTSQKIIGHLFYIASSFVHHLKILGEFKLELLSGNAQFGSKSAIFVSRGNLKFDGWSWKTIGHLFYATLTLEYHFKGIGEFKLELQSGNAKFWSKSAIHCPVWPWNLMLTYDLDKKTIGHLFYVASSFVHHFIAIGEFKLRLQSGNAQFGSKSAIYCPVWIWNLTDDLEKQQGISSMLLQDICIIP